MDASTIMKKYNEEIDRESAYEMLNKKTRCLPKKRRVKAEGKKTTTRRKSTRKEKSTFEKVINSTAGRTIVREGNTWVAGLCSVSLVAEVKKDYLVFKI